MRAVAWNGLLVFLTLTSRLCFGGSAELVFSAQGVASQGDRSVFATPIAYRDGHLALAQVEHPVAGDGSGYLQTVLYLGERYASGEWTWQSKVIESRTLNDPYHAQPSVAFDKHGFVHIAYNMHHVPWQYARSRRPLDVSDMAFLGESVSLAELNTIRLHNKTYFPGGGRAAIPGNQITYPAFFLDRQDDLYVTYRFASRPARAWEDRGYAVGLAKYDVAESRRRPLGGALKPARGDVLGSPDTRAKGFVRDERYLPYLVTLAFDASNGMHAVWTWWDSLSGLARSKTLGPTHAFFPNAELIDVETSWASSRRVPGWPTGTLFNTAKAAAVAQNGDLLVIFEEHGRGRQLVRLIKETGDWGVPVPAPHGASKILVSRDGTEWGIASGLKVMHRRPGGAWSAPWRVGDGLCDPAPVYSEEDNSIYVRAKNCQGQDRSFIYRLSLD